MAEIIASAGIEFSVKKLLSRALKEIGIAKDIDTHLESLQNTKITIEALFLDADKLESLSQAQRLFLERLRRAVDKADDLLDAKAARAKMQQVMGGRSRIKKQVQSFFSSSSNPVISTFRDAKKAKAIRKELDFIARDHAQFGNTLSMLCVTMSQKSLAPSLETGSLIIKEEVIGRDLDRGNIIRMLFSSTSNGAQETFEVISIVGIGGIGKSTLAQYVYNDERMKIHFDVCLWVWATEEFSIRKMLEKILESATGERPDRYEMHLLQSRVQKQIFSKRYLLVLDNLWDNQSLHANWGKLREVLMVAAPGSRILTTTRCESAARVVGTKGDPYVLKNLTDEDSWLLFQRVALFRPWQQPAVEVIGKEIAKMCRNVPLVIRTIGGFLVNKCTVKEWQDFREDEFANLSLYGGDILQTLKLSYDQLDRNLKLCFCFCSLFPKGYVFEKRKLICEFIGLGYVEKEYKKQSLMDAGEACALNLLKRGLFHHLGNDKSFRMHDLIHDLAVSIAGFEFKMVRSKSDEIDERVRHVSFVDVADICWDSLSKLKRVRSFLIEKKNVAHPQLTKLLRFFPCLRMLRLARVGMKEVPTSIGKLIHLRHLDLSRNDFCELPKSVKQLVHLQSLDLPYCDNFKQLPGEIGELSNLLSLNLTECRSLEKLPGEMTKLVKLRHLWLYGCESLMKMPIGLGNLTNLQRLDWFFTRQPSPSDVGGGLSELNTLNNLEGELKILVGGRQCESSAANLQRKEKLVTLDLDFYSLQENHEEVLRGLRPHANLSELVIRDYQGKDLPNWMMKNQLHCSLPNLVEIEIKHANYCRHLCSFGRLPHLKFLVLLYLDRAEYIEEDEDGTPGNGEAISDVSPLFPSLKKLTLGHIPKLEGWQRISRDSRKSNELARPSSFPRLEYFSVSKVGFEVVPDEFQWLSSLRTLMIRSCEGLKEIPKWIDHLTSLKTLEIYDCPKLMPLPKQIGNLPNWESISIEGCPNAFAEWWEDPALPDCPIKQVPTEREWEWEFSSPDYFCCSRY